MAETDGNTSRTALKALTVLDYIGNERRPLTVQEVARGVKADRATTYRLLMTLVQAGYVTRDDAAKTYRLSFRLLSLTRYLISDDERSAQILACLRTISDETGETVHYSALDQDAAVLVFRAKGSQRVAVEFQIGDRSPLHCTSIGKVLLAFADPALTDSVISKGLAKVAPKTITEGAALYRELDKVRVQRYAFDDMEFAPDMRCLALPVFEKGNTVPGGVAISGPSSRFDLAHLARLRDAAAPHVAALSRRLGGTP